MLRCTSVRALIIPQWVPFVNPKNSASHDCVYRFYFIRINRISCVAVCARENVPTARVHVMVLVNGKSRAKRMRLKGIAT